MNTQRLHDLVRYQRSELYNAGLLSDEEYAELVKDHAAVARLESYDEMRKRISTLTAECESWKATAMTLGHPAKMPCGHTQDYSYTEEGGKNIRCLLCSEAALTAERDAAKQWIRAANGFAWAHDESCPRHYADVPCNCGLDDFLGRPRPYVESYEARITELETRINELLTANNAEVEKRRLHEADANQEYAENILLRNECMRQRARAERLGDFIKERHASEPLPDDIAALIVATYPAQQGDSPLDMILAVAAGMGISESQLRSDLNIKKCLKGTETE